LARLFAGVEAGKLAGAAGVGVVGAKGILEMGGCRAKGESSFHGFVFALDLLS
jgi:hypothetical protein